MNSNQASPATTSIAGLILRLFWIFGGHCIVAILAFSIMLQNAWHSVLISSIYLLATISVIVSRFIDIKYFAGQTAEGEPATLTHWKRFCILIAVTYGVGWIAAQLFGRFVM